MKTLGVGVIGFGFIGKVHTYGHLNIPLFFDPAPVRTRLVGVATSRSETAQKAVEQAGFTFGTTDWRELIQREDIDIIHICTPNDQHCEQLLAAMAAGKHIYCDKPLVVHPHEIEAIEQALPQWAGKGQVTLQNRFSPPALRAKQLITQGFVGDVTSLKADYLHSGSVDPDKKMGWKQLKSAGGGVLQDLGSHLLDLVDWMAGPVAEALTVNRVLYPNRPGPDGVRVPVEAEDQTLMLVRLADGGVGTLEATKIATGAEDELRFEICGTRGALRYNSMNPNYLEAYSLDEPERPLGGTRGWNRIATVQRYDPPAGFPGPKFSYGWIRMHMQCLYAFLNAIAEDTQPDPDIRRGLHLQRMLAAAAESAQTGQWMRMPQPGLKQE